MPDTFSMWFIPKMEKIGYEQTHIHFNIESTWINFKSGDGEQFHVMYLKAPMSPEAIRQTFNSHHDPMLFVVDINAIRPCLGIVDAPLWVRILHAIYYGRVYVWDEYIQALHFEWSDYSYKFSSVIEPNSILFTDTDCKLHDFPGIFHIARFYDKAFWKERPAYEAPPREKKQQRRKTEDDVYEAFKQAFREHMRNHGVDYDTPYVRRPSTPSGDKWLQGFMSTGNLAVARVMYKALAKQWHPDLNPGKPQALETMQAINIAFDKVKDILK